MLTALQYGNQEGRRLAALALGALLAMSDGLLVANAPDLLYLQATKAGITRRPHA